MQCRVGCAACCIAISISSPIPGMPDGKPAGIPCLQLDEQRKCRLFGKPERPKVCLDFKASQEDCGDTFEVAMVNLERWERLTR